MAALITWLLLVFLLAAILAGCGGSSGAFSTSQQFIPAEVTKVVDGDTLYLKTNDRQEKVRLIGVNTPEISHPGVDIKEQPYGAEAAAYTRQRLEGKRVYLELDVGERDKYDRLLAYLWLEQPADASEAEVRAKMYNAELLLKGCAELMTVPPNVKYSDLFTMLQQEARQAGRGLWSAAVQGR